MTIIYTPEEIEVLKKFVTTNGGDASDLLLSSHLIQVQKNSSGSIIMDVKPEFVVDYITLLTQFSPFIMKAIDLVISMSEIVKNECKDFAAKWFDGEKSESKNEYKEAV